MVVKHLSSGLLLVTGKDLLEISCFVNSLFPWSIVGPHKLNGVSLRRVNQIYVIATSTKLELSSANFDSYDDKFFKRVRPTKKNAEKDIFDSKKEVLFHPSNRLSVIFTLNMDRIAPSRTLPSID